MGEWPIPRAAIIPTNGRECVEYCLDAIMPQVDFAVVVETLHPIPPRPHVYKWMEHGDINISRWWKNGLKEVRFYVEHSHIESMRRFLGSERRLWDVAIVNDDAIVPEGWFAAVAGKMREMKAAAGSSSPHAHMPILYTQPGPVNLFERMQGFAFIIKGELDMRPNELFSWYCSDDHMDWQARELGGTVVIPGFEVRHLYPNAQVTPQMQVQIAKDMESFIDFWKKHPWHN